MRALLLLVCCTACTDQVSEDANGHLGTMTFSAVEDDCRPRRFTGDTGALFVGRHADDRLVVASSLAAFWGPGRADAGVIAGSRSDFDTGAEIELVLGGDPTRRCGRVRYRWTELGPNDGGVRLELRQSWLQIDVGCPEMYSFLPEQDCTSARAVTFRPTTECRLQCLSPRIDDFTCDC